MSNKKKKKNEFEMETKEMDLQTDKQLEQGSDEKSSEPVAVSDLDRLIEKFPEVEAEKLNSILKDMPFNDAVYVLEEEKSLPSEDKQEVEASSQVEPESNNNNIEKVSKMTEEQNKPVQEEKVDVEAKFNELMAKQNKMQKDLEQKKGGVVTVDDTNERSDRATQIASEGRRKGKAYKPRKGVASFMVTQNARYKASGKPAPYSNECIKNTLMREEGQLEGKA